MRDEFLVFDGADPLAGAGKLLVVIIDDQRLHLGERQRLFHHFGEFAVDDHDFGVGMVEREGDDRGIEPRVERIEHALAHRHAVMALEHGRRIGEQRRHGVAAPDAALGQRRGEPARARIELAVAPPQRPVDDRRVVGKDGGRALEKSERRQRLVVGRIAVKIDVVWRFRHSVVPLWRTLAKRRGGKQMLWLVHRPHGHCRSFKWSSPRKRGPILRSLSTAYGVWVPGLALARSPGTTIERQFRNSLRQMLPLKLRPWPVNPMRKAMPQPTSPAVSALRPLARLPGQARQ